MQSKYEADERGRMATELPSACPWSERAGSCRVVRDHERRRKTGPRFPLTVARCAEHGVAFTLYPPGHVPYARVAIAPLDAAGRPIRSAENEGRPLNETLWEAIADLAQGVRWPESGGAVGCRRTQGRRLHLGATLLGLDVTDRGRERFAMALAVPLLHLNEIATRYAEARGWRAMAEALMEALARSLKGSRGAALIRAGPEANLWGAPRRWEPGSQRFCTPF